MSDISAPATPVLEEVARQVPLGWRCPALFPSTEFVVIWGRNKPLREGDWEPLYGAPPRSHNHQGAGEYLRTKALGYQTDANTELRRLRGQPSALTRKWEMLATAANQWAAELDERGRKRK